MQSSILKWFSRLFRKLNIWFNASRSGKVFNRCSAFLARLLAESFFGRLFVPTGREYFTESLFGKLLGLPVAICRKFYEKSGNFWKNLTGSSSFAVEIKAGGRYFSPQLKTLWPISVQRMAIPKPVR